MNVRALLLLTVLGAALACGGPQPTATADHADVGDDHEGDEVSDLDRPVAELMAARCEHQMAAHECAECRYEVGVVRADDDLFDPAAGGVLAVHEVAAGPASTVREVPGEVVLDGNRTVVVTPLAEGVVTAVRVDLGSRVAAGEAILELECPSFREAAAALVGRLADETAAAAAVAREEDLFERRICPEKDLLEARARLAAAVAERRAVESRLLALGLDEGDLERLRTGQPPGRLPVRSPLAGEVVERRASVGSRVSAGDPLVVVADTSRLWVVAQLRESDLEAALAVDRPAAEVVVAAWPGRVFDGHLERLAGTLDPVTRTIGARIVVDNAERLLRAGMFATVRLRLAGSGSAIVVPREAVLEDEGRSFVFVHVDGPYWVRRPVRLGAALGAAVEIAGGLAVGDRIVTTGAFLFKSDVLRAKMGAGCAD